MQKIYCFLMIAFLGMGTAAVAQFSDSSKSLRSVSGSLTVTNNGISLVPTFSLGKPAAMFIFSLRNKRLSFEPDLRFSLEGKPWSFLFWWRYQLLKSNKWNVRLGAHPAMNFKTTTVSINGVLRESIITRRYLAAELAPNYLLSKNFSMGLYYLYSHCLETDAARNSHFITINANFSNIKLSGDYYMKLVPQVYYLAQDKLDGLFWTAAITVAHKRFPLAVSSIVNKAIRSNLSGSRDFVWNASLIYSFNTNYAKQKK